jgi:hypothetical protein
MTGPSQRRDIDPAVARLLDARPLEIPDEPSLLRQPARALVAVGAIVAIVSSPLPWAARTEIAGDVSRTGWQGTADGFLVAVTAVLLSVLTFNRSAAESKMRLIQRLPAILGATAVVLWLSGLRAMDGEIAIWRLQGYDGAYQVWLFVCLAGVLLLAAGGIWIGTRRHPKADVEPARATPVRRDLLEGDAVELEKVAGSPHPRGNGCPRDPGRSRTIRRP